MKGAAGTRRRTFGRPTSGASSGQRAINGGIGRRTVASLGVRARLVPDDPDRTGEIASLIASCEFLQAECEGVFRKILQVLKGIAEDHDR
jgi:hypothetical protein